ncbi:MAG: hypothetical protein ACOC55_01105 [Candidatus Natronoplasma sp.]
MDDTDKTAIKTESGLKLGKEKLKKAVMMEIEHTTNIACRAFEEMEEAVEMADNEKIWFSVHSFLSAVYQLSKLVRSGRERLMEGDGLEYLGSLLDEDYSFLKTESKGVFDDFRSNFEDWVLDEERTQILEKNVIPKGLVFGMNEEDMLRHLDPETYELTMRGETYDLLEYQKDILQMKKKMDHLVEKSFWEL